MSSRRWNLLLQLLLMALLLLPAAPAGATGQTSAEQPKVLLLYDSLASGTPRGEISSNCSVSLLRTICRLP